MISYRNESSPPPPLPLLSLPCLLLIRASHRVISASTVHALIHFGAPDTFAPASLILCLLSGAVFSLSRVEPQRSAEAQSRARSKQKPEHPTWRRRMRLLDQRLSLKWATADSGWQVSFQDVIEGCMMEAKRIPNKFLRAEDSKTCYSAKAVRPLLERGNISISLAEK